ncbi:MAG TPA: L-ribulose-5-phosphate 4-epimerase AraD [Solirubrobacteraceae bacterium]|jgi:L-ribulose-5-phosphate 4-epimerase|nr:L-ribulose-5-phosphate 4-epimerase AraD [Solirubrobacteraceae bacterium]
MAYLEQLRADVLDANLALPAHGLVKLTWGNVSGVDRDRGVMAIKASGVDYEHMTTDDMVLIDLQSGEVVDGERKPSTDTPTHRALYNAFDGIGGIVHTHSTWATAWAQAEQEIPLLGTTHADLTAESVPLTRQLTAEEVERDYEGETGTVLIELIGDRAEELPAALVRGHAPFCWAASPAAAVTVAVTLEEVARLALLTRMLSPDGGPLAEVLRDKHYQRKHGPNAYYGQR